MEEITKTQPFLLNIGQKEQLLKWVQEIPRLSTATLKTINDFDVYFGPENQTGDILCLYKNYQEKLAKTNKRELLFFITYNQFVNKQRHIFLIIRPRKMQQRPIQSPLNAVSIRQSNNTFNVVNRKGENDFTMNLELEPITGKREYYKYCVRNGRVYLPLVSSETDMTCTGHKLNSDKQMVKTLKGDFLIFHNYILNYLPPKCEVIICCEGDNGGELYKITKEEFIDNRHEKLEGSTSLDALCGIEIARLKLIEKLHKII